MSAFKKCGAECGGEQALGWGGRKGGAGCVLLAAGHAGFVACFVLTLLRGQDHKEPVPQRKKEHRNTSHMQACEGHRALPLSS